MPALLLFFTIALVLSVGITLAVVLVLLLRRETSRVEYDASSSDAMQSASEPERVASPSSAALIDDADIEEGTPGTAAAEPEREDVASLDVASLDVASQDVDGPHGDGSEVDSQDVDGTGASAGDAPTEGTGRAKAAHDAPERAAVKRVER